MNKGCIVSMHIPCEIKVSVGIIWSKLNILCSSHIQVVATWIIIEFISTQDCSYSALQKLPVESQWISGRRMNSDSENMSKAWTAKVIYGWL